MKAEPLIVVANVAAASAFYPKVLGFGCAHGGDEYEMLTYEDKLVLQLHKRDAHEHPGLWQADAPNGNGVILWFRSDFFEATAKAIQRSGAEIVADVHINPNAKQHEIWFRDPDGYLVVVSDNFGDAS